MGENEIQISVPEITSANVYVSCEIITNRLVSCLVTAVLFGRMGFRVWSLPDAVIHKPVRMLAQVWEVLWQRADFYD